MQIRAKADIVAEIREVLAAIERDLDPFLRGDVMNYTGYLAENTVELYALIQSLLGEPQ
jgi:hypothetical protein